MTKAEEIAEEMLMEMFGEHLDLNDSDDILLVKAIKKVILPKLKE